MRFSERDLEDWLWDNPHSLEKNMCWIGRQVSVPSGVIDLLGAVCDRYTEHRISCAVLTLVVVELKADAIRSNALCQAARYRSDVELAIASREPEIGHMVVKAVCLGMGEIDDAVQFAADALDIRLHDISLAFEIIGPWGWKKDVEHKHDSQRDELGEWLHGELAPMLSMPTSYKPQAIGG